MKRTVLLTGASRGIGFETAKQLSKRKYNVIAVARTKNKLKELERISGNHITTLALSITDNTCVSVIKKHLDQQGTRLDGIIHNAGLLINKPFVELTDEEWQQQFDVNLMAPVRLTRDLLSHLNPGSHILHISSMGGFQGSDKFPGLSAYSATKGALSILTECLAGELSGQEITINCLCLGAVQTEMLDQAFPGFKAPVKPEQMGGYIADFFANAPAFYNGKILPVSLNNPS